MSSRTVVVANREDDSQNLTTILKGALFAVAVSLISILVFAFIIKLTGMSTGLINPINQVIKVLSILLGCFYAFRQNPSKGLLKGVLIGVLYTLISFLVFSILNKELEFSKVLINNLVFGALMGAICGAVAVNFKKDK